MKLDLIDLVDWSETEYVELQMTGEPCLHPKIEEIIDLVHKKGVKVGFSTNASSLILQRLASVIDKADAITVNNDMYRQPLFTYERNVYQQDLGIDFGFENYSRLQEPHDTLPHCNTPFQYVSILWNGDVVPCCKDHGGMHVFGNLYEVGWQGVINGDKRKAFLDGIKNNSRNGLCEYCDFANPHLIHEKFIQGMK